MLPKINISKSDIGLEEITISQSKERSNYNLEDNEELTNPKRYLTFESLNEEGERYIQEHMGLPPIDISTAKRYINPHPTESIMSGSESWENWWHLEEFEDQEECCISRVAEDVKIKHTTEHIEQMKMHEERRSYPLTKAVCRERRLKERRHQELKKAQIVSDLETRMVSLYVLKKRYKKNLGVGKGCCQSQRILPPLVESNSLSRQREFVLNQIKRKKIDAELKERKQLERKLHIIEKLLQEQREETKISESNEQRRQYYYRVKPRGQEDKVKVSVSHAEDEERYESEHDVLLDVDHESIVIQEHERRRTESEVILDSKPGDEETGEGDNQDSKGNIDDKPKKTGKGKKSRKSSEGKPRKKKHGKQEKKVSGENEPSAATSREPLELRSEVPDLLLWCDNWRETHEAEGRNLRDIEAHKISLEKDIVCTPDRVYFRDVQGGLKAKQTVMLLNIGMTYVKVRVQEVHCVENEEMAAQLQVSLEGPSKIPTGGEMAVVLTLDAAEVKDATLEVRLLFGRADESKTMLSVWVNVLTPQAEPVLSTSCIRFDPQVFWNTSQFTKQLHIKNLGSVDCFIRWTKQDDVLETFSLDGSQNFSADTSRSEKPEDLQETVDSLNPLDNLESVQVATEVLELVFRNVFSTFRLDAFQNLLLPAGGDVTIPVKFRPAMSSEKGDVFCKYSFSFDADKVKNELQELVVCGHVLDSAFKLSPEVLDMSVCYTGGSVQQGICHVLSTARHACTVRARAPKLLADRVSVLPREAVVQAASALSLTVRVVLNWDFFTSECLYFDKDTSLLSFPVWVTVLDVGTPASPPLEVTVMALVAPPCPLTVSPSCLPLGQVSTQESICADIVLVNHDVNSSYLFCFLNLPESIVVEPGGGYGRILPGESLPLQVMFSPTAKDLGVKCGSPGRADDVLIHLQCYTSVSLASTAPAKDTDTSHISKARNNSLVTTVSTNDQTYSYSEVYVKNIEDSKTPDISITSVKSAISEESLLKEEEKSIEASQQSLKVDKSLSVSVKVKENEDYSQDENKTNHTESDTSMKTSDSVSQRETFEALKNENVWDSWASFLVEEWDHVELMKRDCSFSESNSKNEFIDTQLDDGKETGDDKSRRTDSAESTNHVSITNTLNGETIQESITKHRSRDKSTASSLEILSGNPTNSSVTNQVEDIFDYELLPRPQQRYTSLSLQAHVVDSFVELSAQTVVIPPAACMSHSEAYIYLRSRTQPKCVTHEKNVDFEIGFDFRCADKEIAIKPRKGRIKYKQNIKIAICFKPTLNKREIYAKAFEIKMENMRMKKMEEMLEQYYQSKAKKAKKSPTGKATAPSKKNADVMSKKAAKSEASTNGKRRSKASGVSTKSKRVSAALPDVVIDASQVEVTEEDLRAGRMWLLKYWETQTKQVPVQCVLDTQLLPGVRRTEVLACQVLCTTVAPTLFANSSCFSFEPTAVGCKSTLETEVVNLSFLDAQVHLSTMSPEGPFMCPMKLETPLKVTTEGLTLPPEHTLNLPIRFVPTSQGKFQEVFEVRSDITCLHMRASGEAVTPTFNLSPNQQVFTFTYVPNKKSDVIIKIENTCKAKLAFNLKQVFLKEGFTLPVPEASPPASPVSAKKSSKHEKKTKPKKEFTTLSSELNTCISTEFHDLPLDYGPDSLFQIFNMPSSFEVIPEGSRDIVIRFTSRESDKSSPGSDKPKGKKSPKSTKALVEDSIIKVKKGKGRSKTPESEKSTKNKSKKNSKQDYNQAKKDKNTSKIFATQFHLLLANIILVKDFLILAVPKK